MPDNASSHKRIAPSTMALILVDLQRCFIDESSEHSAKGAMALLERLNALAVRCREAGVLVILIQHVLTDDRGNAGTLPARVAAVAEGMIDERVKAPPFTPQSASIHATSSFESLSSARSRGRTSTSCCGREAFTP